jgi:hypothetical protein
MRRLLITRGTEWGRDFSEIHDWRVLQMTEQPHLCTTTKLAQYPSEFKPLDAAARAFDEFPGAEVYMWDEPDYIPGPSVADHKAVRVVAWVDERGGVGVQQNLKSESEATR